MRFLHSHRRILALGLLYLLGVTLLWLMAVKVFLMLLLSGSSWRWPRVYAVTVQRVVPDPESHFSDQVLALRGERLQWLRMPKQEAEALEPEARIWVLDNYHVTLVRPDQFRLTPLRLALEFPPPLLLALAYVILRIHRSPWAKAPRPEELPAGPRRLLRDDFHLRALRHEPQGEEGPKGHPGSSPPQGS